MNVHEKDNPYKHFSLVCYYILGFFPGHFVESAILEKYVGRQKSK